MVIKRGEMRKVGFPVEWEMDLQRRFERGFNGYQGNRDLRLEIL